MQKKIIAVLLAVLLIAAIIPFTVSAAEPYEITLEVGKVSAEAAEGTSVAVPVNLTKSSGYISGALWVDWDKNVLTLESVDFTELGPNDGSPSLTDEIKTGGRVKFRLGDSAADEETGSNIEGTGVLLTLNFTVNAGAVEGEYPVTITNADFLDFDPDAPDIDATIVDGSVTLTGAETPTEEPEQPTEEPEQPTEEPEQPTEEPEQPTEEPEQPTEEPEQPTEEPEQPTEEPPVEAPTEAPVDTPTEEPVETPTEEIVVTPTEEIVVTPTETATEEATEPTTSPKTGDSSNMNLWLVIMLITLGGVCAVLTIAKRKGVFSK